MGDDAQSPAQGIRHDLRPRRSASRPISHEMLAASLYSDPTNNDLLINFMLDFVDAHLGQYVDTGNKSAFRPTRGCALLAEELVKAGFKPLTETQVNNRLYRLYRTYHGDDPEKKRTGHFRNVPQKIWREGRAAFDLPERFKGHQDDSKNSMCASSIRRGKLELQLAQCAASPGGSDETSTLSPLDSTPEQSLTELHDQESSWERDQDAQDVFTRTVNAIKDLFEGNAQFDTVPPQAIDGRMALLLSKISETVEKLLIGSGRSLEQLPRLDPTLWPSDLEELVALVFGPPGRVSDPNTISNAQKKSRLCLFSFLRSLIAAAVTEWIFRRWSLPELERRNCLSDLYVDALREGSSATGASTKITTMNSWLIARFGEIDIVSPQLQVLFADRCKAIYLEQIGDNLGFLTNRAHQLAARLDSCLLELTAAPPGVTLSTSPELDLGWPGQWQNDLSYIFRQALDIRLRLARSHANYGFEWPRFGELFDPAWMVTEDGASVERGKSRVYIALSCAIRCTFHSGASLSESFVSRATVLLL